MPKLSLVALLALVPALNAQERDSQRGFLGVHVAPIDAKSRAAYEIPERVTAGAVLTHIEEGSAAQKAGLRVGDVLVWFDGKAVASVDDLIARVQKRKPGEQVTYRVHRKSGSIEGTLRLGRRPERVVREEPRPRPKDDRSLDRRLDDVAEQIARLRKRVAGSPHREAGRELEVSVVRKPRRLEDWLRREEEGLASAHRAGNERQLRFHTIRLGLLRELRQAGFERPHGRMGALERKLDRVLELLERRNRK